MNESSLPLPPERGGAAAATRKVVASVFDEIEREIFRQGCSDVVGLRGYFVKHRKRLEADCATVLSLRPDGRVLEVGAFPYFATIALDKLGVPAVGVDVDPERLRAVHEGYGLELYACDVELEPLPFEGRSFPLVLFCEILEHLRIDPLYALSEINRVTRPGGRMLLTTPNLYSVQNVARFCLGRPINDPLTEFGKLRELGHMGHVHEYSRRELERLLGWFGFEIEYRDFRHYHYPLGKRGWAARVAFGLLPKRARTFQVVIARKARGTAPLEPIRGLRVHRTDRQASSTRSRERGGRHGLRTRNALGLGR